MNIKQRILLWVLYTAAVSAFPALAALPKSKAPPAVFLKEPAPAIAANRLAPANQPARCNTAVRYDDGLVVQGCSVNAPRRALLFRRCGPVRRLLKFIPRRNRR